MSKSGRRLRVLLVECDQAAAEEIISELGFWDWQADTCGDLSSALAALRSHKHYDLILTNYEGTDPDEMELLREVHSLDHRKHIPVLMVARKAEAGRKMSEKGKAREPRRRKHGLTPQMKALAASALAQRVGYLRVEDFSDRKPFDDLPTQSYGPHKIIRFKKEELLLVTRGMVEVWHTHHDILVKKLMIGTLFGEMSLLGQTMVITKAVAGNAGATVAVIGAERVRELIKANAISIAENLLPRLAAADVGHYRANFQKADSRVAALLLELAGAGSTVEGLMQSQLSERIGLVRETVALVLGTMKQDKLIAIDRKKTTILNRKALEELSQL